MGQTLVSLQPAEAYVAEMQVVTEHNKKAKNVLFGKNTNKQ